MAACFVDFLKFLLQDSSALCRLHRREVCFRRYGLQSQRLQNCRPCAPSSFGAPTNAGTCATSFFDVHPFGILWAPPRDPHFFLHPTMMVHAHSQFPAPKNDRICAHYGHTLGFVCSNGVGTLPTPSPDSVCTLWAPSRRILGEPLAHPSRHHPKIILQNTLPSPPFAYDQV